ncbi:hypothetical protein D3C75_480620 [compost metagenome]
MEIGGLEDSAGLAGGICGGRERRLCLSNYLSNCRLHGRRRLGLRSLCCLRRRLGGGLGWHSARLVLDKGQEVTMGGLFPFQRTQHT